MSYRGILICTLLSAAACNKMTVTEFRPAAETVSVTIGAGTRIGIGSESRTQLDEDGVSVRWEETDRIALWAENSGGETAFEGVPFALWHYNETWQSAQFRGDIPAMNDSETYKYYAVSPVPASAAAGSREVSYEIPAVQDGTFHGEWDILVADPVGTAENPAPALVAGDNSKSFTLNFHHKVHVLRIRIPENNLGEKITQMTLNFPTAVAGTLTVDITDPTAAPAISGSQSITLQFAEPKDVGDVVYATIAPVALSDSQEVEMLATGSIYESQPRTFGGKVFEAGHTTPIAYHIPEQGRIIGTMIRFTLGDTGESTLGESVERIWLDVDGVALDAGTATNPFTVNQKGEYEILFPKDSDLPQQLSGKTTTVYYDSEHATVAKAFPMQTINIHSVNTVALPGVPYLFEENFDTVPGFSYDDNNGTGATSGGSNSAKNLQSEYGMPSGWTGARCGAEAGKAIRICSRNECAAGVRGSYHGRIDSPELSGLKTTVNVIVKFNYSIARNSNQGNAIQPYLAVGAISSDDSNRDTSSKTWGTLVSGGDPGTILQHNISAAKYDLNDGKALNGSYDNIGLTADYTVSAASNYRLVWEVYMKEGEPKNAFKYYYSNNWVYIDNIKVSIAK